MMAMCNVMQFPFLFSQIFFLHRLSSLSVTLKTNKACPSGGVPPRSSGEEKLNELLHEVTGDGSRFSRQHCCHGGCAQRDASIFCCAVGV